MLNFHIEEKNYLSKITFLFVTVLLFLFCTPATLSASVMDDIKADMTLNEAVLMNTTTTARWADGAVMSMGNAPRGDATPVWWTPSNTALKSSTPWNAIAPWFVVYPGVNHKATNVRVKIYEITPYALLKSTNKWVKVNTDGKPTWASNYKFNLGSKIDKALPRVESDGQLSYKLNGNFNPIHGGIGKFDLTANGINPKDVLAVFVYAKTELILDDPLGVDDRASAQILFSIGADYYPTVATVVSDFTPMTYVPNSGGSRYGLVKSTTRTHYLSTINPPGTSSNISEYVKAGNSVSIPVTQFEANMPPIGGVSIVTSSTTVPTLSFSVTPTTVTSGSASTLVWSSTDTTACTASGAWSGSKTVSGREYTGDLISSKTYTLSCTGTGGTVTKSVTVEVVPVVSTDTTLPLVSMIAPVTNQIISGNFNFKVSANDNVAVSQVELFIDGSNKGVATSSYVFPINTKKIGNGTHFVFARATDTSGNKAYSPSITFKVENQGGVQKQVATPQSDTIFLISDDMGVVSASTSTNITSACVGQIVNTLTYGTQDPQVSILQCQLTNLGYLELGNVTGYFGPKTLNAVKRMQCEKNVICEGDTLSTGYGLVGPKTRAVLGY